MNRYQVKYADSKYHVIDSKNGEKAVSSGYYDRGNAETVCDKKNMQNDLGGLLNMKL